MNRELENFLGDLVFLIQEKYNDTFEQIDKNEYREGQTFAYFDVISLIQSQAIAFGYKNFAEKIKLPDLINKIELNK